MMMKSVFQQLVSRLLRTVSYVYEYSLWTARQYHSIWMLGSLN